MCQDGTLFSEVNTYYKRNLVIGLINISLLLKVNLDFINLDYKFINYTITEMKLIIHEILERNI